MARPRKNKTPVAEITEVKTSASEDIPSDVMPATDSAPVLYANVDVQPVVKQMSNEDILSKIQPEVDRHEMSRYFCVINNSEEASRIMDAISHQRDLEMWGVHQYDKNQSRNSYSRSFYFKNRDNAVTALNHAKKLAGS